MSENFWRIVAHKTKETDLWWEVARQYYQEIPESVPEVLYQLIDDSSGDTEAIATRSEIKDVQSWAIGLPGWKVNPSPLEFIK